MSFVHRRALLFIALVLPLVAAGEGVMAQTAAPAIAPEFFTKATNAILMDARTGKSIFEKDADTPVSPCQHEQAHDQIMVFERLADGTLTLDTEFLVSKNAWKRGGARGPAAPPCTSNRNAR